MKKLGFKKRKPTVIEVLLGGIILAIVMLWATNEIEADLKARRELKYQEQAIILEEQDSISESVKNLVKENDLMKEDYEYTLKELFYKYCGKYNVEFELVYAISIHETGNFTSSAYRNLNNVGGNMGKNGLISFSTKEKGIEYMIKNLKNNYIDMGLTTIKTIQPKYCPIGATNDPDNLNVNWTKKVTQFYNELKEGK